jgi:hypothetical protein
MDLVVSLVQSLLMDAWIISTSLAAYDFADHGIVAGILWIPKIVPNRAVGSHVPQLHAVGDPGN